MEPIVSVICITRNHERFCIESLDSVLNQTYKNIEWIILDASSTDNTVELIDNWLVENNIQAVFLKEKELKPITVNLNIAMTHAHGEYVQFLSLDDVLVLDKITLQVNEFKNLDSTYVCIYTDSQVINENSELICESGADWYKSINKKMESFPDGSLNVFNELCKGNFTSMLTMLFRLDAINNIGGFDEKLSYEDHDLHLRLTRTFKYKYFDIQTIRYRIHSNNLHKNKKSFHQLRDEVLIFYKHLDTMSGRKAFLTRLKTLLRKFNNLKELKYISKHTLIPYSLLIMLKVSINFKTYINIKILNHQK